MDRFSKNVLRDLMDKKPGLCVSIYAPTHRSGPEVQQGPIRLKNLLKRAEEQLVEGGLRAPEARAVCFQSMGDCSGCNGGLLPEHGGLLQKQVGVASNCGRMVYV